MNIRPVFNVENLLPYRYTFEPSTLPFSVSAGETSKGTPTMPLLQYSMETVDITLDDEFVTFRDYGFHRFLSKWHSHPDFDATLIKENDLRHLDPSLLIATFSFTLRSRVLFNPEGMMRHGIGPYLGLNEIRSPSH